MFFWNFYNVDLQQSQASVRNRIFTFAFFRVNIAFNFLNNFLKYIIKNAIKSNAVVLTIYETVCNTYFDIVNWKDY